MSRAPTLPEESPEVAAARKALLAMSLEELADLRQDYAIKLAALDSLIARRQANDPWIAVAKGEGPEPDRAVGLSAAAEVLGMSRDYLYRHWATMGGYKDRDRKVKFSMRALKRHVKGQHPR